MSERGDDKLRQARGLQERLKAEGRNRDAEIVGALCRTYSSSRVTNRLLHRDNMELREKIT